MAYNDFMAHPSEASTAMCHVATPEASNSFEEVALSVLRSSGCRITKPRIQVIRTLAGSHRAQSAYSIHEQIVAKGEKVDVVSVYRILSALQELGLVHRVGIIDGFIPCRIDGEHDGRVQHLVCKQCGCVTELTLPESSVDAAVGLSDEQGFKAEDIRLEMLGTCAHCQATSG